MTSPPQVPDRRDTDAFGERVLSAALGMTDMLAIYLGDRLGWYRSLSADGPATAEELARRTGTHPRYAREWLEQQAVNAVLAVDEDRRFSLPPGAEEVLTDRSSLSYMAPLARMLAAAAGQLPALLEAYRSGGGVSWSQFGADARESQADMNRPWYEKALPEALKGVASLDVVLSRPGARIADVGCGAGWSSLALARTYPAAVVEGVDIDAPSIGLALGNAAASGMTDRLTFRCADAEEAAADSYDAIFAFECVHDMPRPVDVLAAARRALAPGRTMIVMDEAVAESFSAPGDELERLMYGFSLLICLPDGLSHPPSAGTGTVMRPATLRQYALDAGFTGMNVLPISAFGFWRFYELTTAPV